jgi:hypothetical protein
MPPEPARPTTNVSTPETDGAARLRLADAGASGRRVLRPLARLLLALAERRRARAASVSRIEGLELRTPPGVAGGTEGDP